MSISIRDLTLGFDGRTVVAGVGFEAVSGELTALLGPNGAGKSSLVACISALVRPLVGDVRLLGTRVQDLDRRALAQRLATVHQREEVAEGFTVAEVVAMGRTPFLSGWMVLDGDDERRVQNALERVGLAAFGSRCAETLSGGEYRLVSLARALAQDVPILVLDEPTAHLDPRHEERVMSVAKAEAQAGRTVLVVLHDVNLALECADRVVVLGDGRLVANGPPEEVLTSELVSQLYGTKLVRRETDVGSRFLRPGVPGG